ncbi:MAG: hypothetical protein JWR03_2071, partial [Cohnella sp.]|nr:hypothetical protein [Cohnella sp.]
MKRGGCLFLAFFVLTGGAGLRPVVAAASSTDSRHIVSVAAGVNHAVALAKDGTVWSWGVNYQGQLGLGKSVKDSLIPVQVPGLSGITAVASGSDHNMALGRDGTVWVWGSNIYGQKGDGTYTAYGPPDSQGSRSVSEDRSVYEPVPVPGLSGIVGIAASPNGGLAWDADGRLWTWGNSSMSLSYDGMDQVAEKNKLMPHLQEGIGKVVYAAANYSLIAATDADGSVWILGAGPLGEFGDGTRSRVVRTVRVPGVATAVRVDLSSDTVVAFLKDGTVKEWGQALLEGKGFNPTDASQIDRIPVNLAPTLTAELQGFSAVVSTTYKLVEPSVLGLKQDGSVWTQGSNANGQQGVEGVPEQSHWAKLVGLPNIVSIGGIAGNCFAVGEDGSVWTWGSNGKGQLGDGTSIKRTVPKALEGFGGASPVIPEIPPVKTETAYRLIVDGKTFPLAERPALNHGSLAIRLGDLSRAYGAKLTFDKAKQSAVLVHGKYKALLKLNSGKMVVNGKSTKLPFAPVQKGSDWLVPADGLAKA